MKPAPFDYVAPGTLPEALRFLADEEREVKILAGGQSLVPMLNMRLARPELLVDITRIPELRTLDVEGDGALRIGAGVRQAAVAVDPAVSTGWPLLTEAIGHIGHPQIRNRGTVCGSLVHHDPAAELPTAALALDARFDLSGPAGTRTVDADDFFLSTFLTALEADEIVTSVRFDAQPPRTGWAFEELARRRGDFAAIGVAVLLTRAGAGGVDRARVVFCAAGSRPLRLLEAEEALLAAEGPERPDDAFAAAGAAARARLDPPSDVHADAEWRREAAETLLVRACNRAWERTGD